MKDLSIIEFPTQARWRDRGQRVLGALVVVLCYLVVFAGILFSIAGGAS